MVPRILQSSRSIWWIVLVEAYAGLAAVSLHLMGEVPPASRVGSKAGYAKEIVGIAALEGEREFLLIDEDPLICNFLRCLFNCRDRLQMSDIISAFVEERPEELWRRARSLRSADGVFGAAMFLLHLAGARGGIGGFKKGHIRRPNVDGFTPNRRSLVRRLVEWKADGFDVEIRESRIESIVPTVGAKVYMDPPYRGRLAYSKSTSDVREQALRWREAGNHVFISEAQPVELPGAVFFDLTDKRVGQSRRSLTTNTQEWLTCLS